MRKVRLGCGETGVGAGSDEKRAKSDGRERKFVTFRGFLLSSQLLPRPLASAA